jgi:hypothetical protein
MCTGLALIATMDSCSLVPLVQATNPSASMKADGAFHIDAPLLNGDRHPWKLEFLQGGLKGGVRGAPG